MASTLKRAIAAAGATALIAGVAIAAAPAAQADGDYYGTWTLIAVTNGADKVKCDDPVREPDSFGCPGGQSLILKPDYRYAMSKYVFAALLVGRKGTFVAPVFPSTGDRVLVFKSATGGVSPLSSAWQMVLKDKRAGSPTKMILSMETGLGEVGMIFRRDAK